MAEKVIITIHDTDSETESTTEITKIIECYIDLTEQDEIIPLAKEAVPIVENPISAVVDESEPILVDEPTPVTTPVMMLPQTEEWDIVDIADLEKDEVLPTELTNENGKRELECHVPEIVEPLKKKKKTVDDVIASDVPKEKKSKKERKEKKSKKDKKDKKEKKSKKSKKDKKEKKSKKERKEDPEKKEKKSKKKEKTTGGLNVQDFVIGASKKKKAETPVSNETEKPKSKPKKPKDPNAPAKKRLGLPSLARAIAPDDIRIHVKTTKQSKDMVIWNDGKNILKGKYTPDMKKKLLAYCDLFKAINIKELTGANVIFSSAVYKDKQSFYFEYPNLAVTKPEEWITKEVVDYEKNPVKICDRGSMGIKTYAEYILEKENQEKFKNEHFPIIYATFMWFGTLGFTHRTLDNILVVGNELHFILPEKTISSPFKGKNLHSIVFSETPSGEFDELYADAFDIHADVLNTKLETLKTYAGCTLADVEEIEQLEDLEDSPEDGKEEQNDDPEKAIENADPISVIGPISFASLPDLNAENEKVTLKPTILHSLLKDDDYANSICMTMIKNHRDMLRNFV